VDDVSVVDVADGLTDLQEVLHDPLNTDDLALASLPPDQVSEVSRLAILHDYHVYIVGTDWPVHHMQKLILILDYILVL
jgi:hypothetical protein